MFLLGFDTYPHCVVTLCTASSFPAMAELQDDHFISQVVTLSFLTAMAYYDPPDQSVARRGCLGCTSRLVGGYVNPLDGRGERDTYPIPSALSTDTIHHKLLDRAAVTDLAARFRNLKSLTVTIPHLKPMDWEPALQVAAEVFLHHVRELRRHGHLSRLVEISFNSFFSPRVAAPPPRRI